MTYPRAADRIEDIRVAWERDLERELERLVPRSARIDALVGHAAERVRALSWRPGPGQAPVESPRPIDDDLDQLERRFLELEAAARGAHLRAPPVPDDIEQRFRELEACAGDDATRRS